MRQSTLTSPMSARLPKRRSNVMSLLPPPFLNLVPLAKSAPSRRARTNFGISQGSAEPSASIMTMMSPVAIANPHARAFPLPRRLCMRIRASGRRRRTVSRVPSTE